MRERATEREGDHNDITVGLEGLIASSTLELRSVVRGAIGRYCIHFHLMRDCPDCLAHANSVEFAHQRGSFLLSFYSLFILFLISLYYMSTISYLLATFY